MSCSHLYLGDTSPILLPKSNQILTVTREWIQGVGTPDFFSYYFAPALLSNYQVINQSELLTTDQA